MEDLSILSHLLTYPIIYLHRYGHTDIPFMLTFYFYIFIYFLASLCYILYVYWTFHLHLFYILGHTLKLYYLLV